MNKIRVLNPSVRQDDGVEIRFDRQAFERRIQNIILTVNDNECRSLMQFFEKTKDVVIRTIQKELERLGCVKINFRLLCRMEKTTKEEIDCLLKTQNKTFFMNDSLREKVDSSFDRLLSELQEIEMKGSGWMLKTVEYLNISVNKHNPLKCGSYIPLPEKFNKTRSIVNIQDRKSVV